MFTIRTMVCLSAMHLHLIRNMLIAVRIENGYSSGNACLAADDIFKYIFELADEQSILTGVAASDTSDTSND